MEFSLVFFSPDKIFQLSVIESRSSAVGTATGYELDDRVVADPVPLASRIFISPYRPHPASYPTAIVGTSPGVKQPGVKLTTHHQYTQPPPPHVFMA
jgi:hypothetical protein